MVLYPELLLVAPCPCCAGQILYRTISRFELRNPEGKTVRCHNGREFFSCRLSGKKHLYIEVAGVCCTEKHAFIYKLDELSGPLPIEMVCADSGIYLGYLGRREQVTEALDSDFLGMMNYSGDDLQDVWAQPDLVVKTVCRLNRIYAKRNLFCGECGSHNIDVETDHDNKIGLVCADCGAGGFLSAWRRSSWHILRRAEQVLLSKEGLRLKLGKEPRKLWQGRENE